MDKPYDVAELARTFDQYDPVMGEAVFDVLAAMREQDGELSWVESEGGRWIITGQAALHEAANDWHTFSSDGAFGGAARKGEVFVPIEFDPPVHLTWRRVLNPMFSPQEMQRLRPAMNDIADRLIDAFAAAGVVDLAADYAEPLQGEIFFRLVFGLTDEAEISLCRQAAADGVFASDPLVRRAGFMTVSRFVRQMYQEREERAKQCSVVDLLNRAEIDGAPVTEDKFAGVLSLLVFGGNETTVNGLLNTLHHLVTNAGDRDRLLADPSLVRHAVEESLRFESPVIGLARKVTCDVTFHGKDLKAGDTAVLSWMAANRDPAAWEDADTYDLDRERSHAHASFGIGPHRCLGSHLARAILLTGVERLLQRLPDVRLEPGASVPYRTGSTRGPSRLPAVFTPVAS
jgi:cytochrome P450